MDTADSYREKPATYFANARPEMLAYVPATVAHVLEIGCGSGGFGASVKAARRARVTGIEPHAEAAAAARAHLDEVLAVPVEQGLRELADTAFDCIVCNDVLEHLVDPEAVLVAAHRVLRSAGVVVASIPNVRYLPVLRSLVLDGDWRYADEGVLDRTHLRFFTMKSAAAMFARCGYRVRALEGINARSTSWKFSLLAAATRGAASDMRYQQIAIVAERA
jgi:2-polyprenyl-3-methyl-5-hydroxy-6-metoxy-1,4-benzoquinol methylase